MTLLRNTKAPVRGPGGLCWDNDKHQVEVDPALAVELLRSPDGGFVEVTNDRDALAAEKARADEQKARETALEAEAKVADKKAADDRENAAKILASAAEIEEKSREDAIAAALALTRKQQAGQEQVPVIARTDEVNPAPLNALTEPAPVDLPLNEKSPLVVKTPENDKTPVQNAPKAEKVPAKK